MTDNIQTQVLPSEISHWHNLILRSIAHHRVSFCELDENHF
uniref:Uncharacterized protein n=1 Tax=Rhizophora mucronata TaxID=61149 RepID=A0A2P2P5I8_RHIMU